MAIKSLNDYIKDNEINMNQKFTGKQIQDITWTKKQKQSLTRYQPKKKEKKGNILTRAIATVDDLAINIGKGFLNTAEGIADTISYLGADVADFFGADEYAKEWRKSISRDLIGESFDNKAFKQIEKQSYNNNFVRSVAQGVGNVGAMAGGGTILGGSVPGTIANSFTSAYGNATSQALRNGADMNTARKAGLINGTAEAISEQFFDALPGMKVEGWGSKVVGKIGSGVERYFGTNTGKLVIKALNASGEGFEEIISNMLTSAGNDIIHHFDKNYTYGMENQTGNILKDVWKSATSKESWDSFISAALTSAITNGANTLVSNTQKNNIIKSYAKENNMSFKEVKDMFNQSVQEKNQIQTQQQLGMNLGQRIETEQQNKIKTLDELKRGTFVQTGTETQKYQYKETDNQKLNEMNKSLSEVANNTQLTRETAKTAERLVKDLGFNIKFTNNEQIQNQIKNGEIKAVDGANINGYVKNGTMYINVDSDQLANFTIGHETKHFFEANEELNNALNQSLKEYAQQKGVWDKMLAERTDLYTDKDGNLVGDPEGELLADLSGQFFTDYDFVNNLSTKNPSLFQKTKDFFQKLYYKATGQQEKLLLKQINENFNKVYREYAKTQPKQEGTKFLLSYANTAKLSEKQSTRLNEAIKMKDNNSTSEEIWNKTGVMFDEGKAKLYVDDLKLKNDVEKLIKTNKQIKLSELFDSKVFENYPELKDYYFEVRNFEQDAIDEGLSQEQIEKYKKVKGTTTEDNGVIVNSNLKSIDEMENVLSHEVQHLIQEINGDKTDSNKVLEEQGKKTYRKLPIELEAETNRILHNMTPEQRKNIDPQSIRDEILKYYEETGYEKSVNVNKIINRLVNKHGIQYSLSVKDANTIQDNEGRKLSKDQQNYFENSMVTDENGNIIRVYHTTGGTNVPFSKAQFNVFNPVGTPGYRYGNQVVNFFTDSKDMSGSYVDQNYEMADTSRVNSIEDAEGIVDYYNGSGMIDYSIQENDGKYELYDNEADEVLHTFDSQEDLFKNIKQTVIEYSQLDEFSDIDGYQYEGYLNITNPYIIDAQGSEWNRIKVENRTELKQQIKEKWDTSEMKSKNLEGETLKKLNRDITKIGFQVMPDKYGDLCIFDKNGEFSIDVRTVNDVIEELRDDLNLDDNVGLSTNDVVFSVLAENAMGANYDGVIFKNVVDYGGANLEEQTPNNVYVTFKENQFKAVNNETPTEDSDIRYSISQEGQNISEELDEFYTPKNKVTTRLSDLKRKEVELPIEEEKPLKLSKNEQKQANEIKEEYLPLVKDNEVLRVDAENIAKEINKTGDFDTTKQRKWIQSLKNSDAIQDKGFLKDLNMDKLSYEVQTNQKSLDRANDYIENNGYENSLNHVKDLIRSEKTPTATDVALLQRMTQEAIKNKDYQTAQELIMDTAILGTDLGQAVQAMSIIQKLTPEGQLKLYTKMINRAKIRGEKAFTDVEITPDMVETVLGAYNEDGTYDQDDLTARVEKFKQDVATQMKSTVGDKVNAWRYLSMLGNPKTHIRNVVSNVAMKGTIKVKNTLARTLETVLPIKERTKTFERASKEIKNYAKETAAEMKGIITGENKYNEKVALEQEKQIFKIKALEGISRFNSAALEAEDWFFSRSAFESNLSEYLTANGVKSMEDVKNNPEIVEKAKIYAVEQAEIATFRQYSKLASEISRIERNGKLSKYALNAVLPFKKTPINVAKAGFNYSPLGLIKNISYDAYQLKKGNINGSQFVDNISQGLTGTSVALLGYALAKAGILSGGGDDDKEGKYDSQLGKQSYALNIGGKTYSISWLSPTGMPLLVGANLYEKLEEDKDWSFDVVADTLANTLDPMSEMSFLSSLTDVLKSYNTGGTQMIKSMAEAGTQSYILQFFPTLFGQLASTLDDTKRSTKASNNSNWKFGEETIRKIMLKVPGLRNQLEEQTDIWGNAKQQTNNIITRAVENFIAPYSKTEDITSDLDKEIKRVFNKTGETSVIPGIPQAYVKKDDETFKMSASEYTKYKQTFGQTANSTLNELVNSSSYKNADDEDKVKMIENVYKYAREQAKQEYFNSIKENYSSKELPKVKKAEKNYGISAADYYGNKDEYSYANKNPERYLAIKAVGDYNTYETYKQEIKNIKDTYAGNENKDIRKQEIFNYINSLPLSVEQKLILQKVGAGYSVKNEAGRLRNYIDSLDLSVKDKQAIDKVLFK